MYFDEISHYIPTSQIIGFEYENGHKDMLNYWPVLKIKLSILKVKTVILYTISEQALTVGRWGLVRYCLNQ